MAVSLYCLVPLALFVIVAIGPARPPPPGPAPKTAIAPAWTTRPAKSRRPGSAAAAVEQLYLHMLASTNDVRAIAYDPTDAAAAKAINGWPPLTSGECRLTVIERESWKIARSVAMLKEFEGQQTVTPMFAGRKDGVWKIILPGGNYRQGAAQTATRGRKGRGQKWSDSANGMRRRQEFPTDESRNRVSLIVGARRPDFRSAVTAGHARSRI